MSISLAAARAEASRRNGARSRGPKTPEGRARTSQNALKHGFRAQQHVVLPSEDAAAFEALEAALMEELAPEGALQCVLARRVVAAAWRLERAERLEAELFERHHFPGGNLGLALIRDGNGPRSFDTLLRYRGGTLAELWRALRTLKALQAEQAQAYAHSAAAHASVAAAPLADSVPEIPIEPEARGIARQIAAAAPPDAAAAAPARRACAPQPAAARAVLAPPPQAAATGVARILPIEPEGRGNPGQTAPRPAGASKAGHPDTLHRIGGRATGRGRHSGGT
jgi:hypothetical protein